MHKSKFDVESLEFKRKMLREILNKCKPREIDLFKRMYGSIEDIEEHKMSWAYQQCQRTLAKSERNK